MFCDLTTQMSDKLCKDRYPNNSIYSYKSEWTATVVVVVAFCDILPFSMLLLLRNSIWVLILPFKRVRRKEHPRLIFLEAEECFISSSTLK